jgi:hypothetical protein
VSGFNEPVVIYPDLGMIGLIILFLIFVAPFWIAENVGFVDSPYKPKVKEDNDESQGTS